MRLQARPRVRTERGWVCPRARDWAQRSSARLPASAIVGQGSQGATQALGYTPSEMSRSCICRLHSDGRVAGVGGDRVAVGVAGATVADLL